jgi:hypothetical protein
LGFEQALLDRVNIWLVSRRGWRCRHRAISSGPKTRDSSFKAADADNAGALKSKRAGTRTARSRSHRTRSSVLQGAAISENQPFFFFFFFAMMNILQLWTG